MALKPFYPLVIARCIDAPLTDKMPSMIEFIKQIPGPWFLLYYAIYALVCIIVGRIFVKSDGTLSDPVPENAGLDATDASLIADGFKSVLRTRVFAMLQAGLLKIHGSKKDAAIAINLDTHSRNLNPIDAAIHDFLRTPRKPADLFTDPDLKATIEIALSGVKEKLTRLKLITTPDQKIAALYKTLLVLAVMLVPGLTKLTLGISRNKPVGFLVILLIASTIAMVAMMKPWNNMTALGAKYLLILRHRFAWVKKRKAMPSGVDPALMVALFGTGATIIAAAHPSYSEAFSRGRTGSGGCGAGGCGSSSGCSGGGCGGGCGGCGG